MSARTRQMAACLHDARHAIVWPAETGLAHAILDWQRAKACRDQRLAMQITDDKTLDELEQIEHETRLAARSACEAVGIDWRSIGDIG